VPAISVITPTFNTPAKTLARTWASLKRQTFTDWEWVVWDDSTQPETWAQLYGFASDERYKLVAHKSHAHSGVIGSLKRRAFMAAEGEILVELDHDDELTPDALQKIYDAFSDSEVGFVYSDWAEVFPDGSSKKYGDGWGFGFGETYWHEQRRVWCHGISEISGESIKHIVSVPNHVRAWRAYDYRAMGGHNPALPVADDYELIVRTYKQTCWKRIPELLYIQHVGEGNTHVAKNALIQSLVAQIRADLVE
jgi:O-antigen biosynthesis protein